MRRMNDMKKIYENPKMQLLAIASMDVITASDGSNFTVSSNPHSLSDLGLDYTVSW